MRGLGQLCHLLGVLSGRGEGRALFGAAGRADSRGAGRGRTPSPSACAPPRASLHVALGAVGSEPCRSPAALRAAHQGAQRLLEEGAGENFPGWLWAGSEAERAGRAALLARSGHTCTHCHQRAPPRFARESASLRLLSTPFVSIWRLAPPPAALIGGKRPQGLAAGHLLASIGPRDGLFRLLPRLLVTFREATFLWG